MKKFWAVSNYKKLMSVLLVSFLILTCGVHTGTVDAATQANNTITGYMPWTWNSSGRIIDDNSTVWFADINGDGKSDMISKGQTGAYNSGVVYVALSNGSGYPWWTWDSGNRMIDDNSSMWFADVNGDGKADLISKGQAGSWNAGYVYVSLSTGNGFQPWTWYSGQRMIDDNGTMWFADVNGDGRADLITKGLAGSATAGYVKVSLSNGTGYQSWTWSSGKRMIDDNSSIWLADVNGDGKADMITKGEAGAWNAGYVYVSLSNGTGFPGWNFNTGKRMLDDNSTIWLADVNGDGKADLISKGEVGAYNSGVVYVAMSNGTGYPWWTWDSGQRMIDDNSTMWFADVNGDKKSDMITKGQAGVWNTGQVYLSLSTGNGFQPWTWNSENTLLKENENLWFADVNGDGRADLVTCGRTPDRAGRIFVALSTDFSKIINEYNDAGQLKKTTLPDGTEIYYDYDKNGNLIRKGKK